MIEHLRFKAVVVVVGFFVLLSSSGCVVKEMGNTVKHSIKGDFMLSREDYSSGVSNFRQEVESNPQSSSANYYYGRFLLAEKKYAKALKYLQKASLLDRGNPDYHFWTGVAYSSLGKKQNERKRYQTALALKENHLQSLIYLGHNLLESKKYAEALKYYSRALAIWAESPSSLYNRALILTKLGRIPEAVDGWLEYLYYYPSGGMARQAVDHLNSLNDFSYRNFQLLARTVTTEKIYFEPFSAKIARASHPSLKLIGSVFSNMKKGRLQIVAYQLNNKELAKQKAINAKRYLLENFKDLKKEDIGVSWFGTAEDFKKQRGIKKVYDSMVFFISM